MLFFNYKNNCFKLLMKTVHPKQKPVKKYGIQLKFIYVSKKKKRSNFRAV